MGAPYFVCRTPDLAKDMKSRACALRDERYGKRVFKRGLINSLITVRMIAFIAVFVEAISLRIGTAFPKKKFFNVANRALSLVFRTFVLQGGEDPYYTDARMVSIVSSIREAYPEVCDNAFSCERSGRSRIAHFVLQELIDICCARRNCRPHHYGLLHPNEMSLSSRKKEMPNGFTFLGYQVGQRFYGWIAGPNRPVPRRGHGVSAGAQAHMIGIGPFVPHKDTPFAHESQGALELTLFMLFSVALGVSRCAHSCDYRAGNHCSGW